MPERMADVVRAVGEAVVDGDAMRLRRLLEPDARVDSATGRTGLTRDEFVELHSQERPYNNWQISTFEPLDNETAVVTATITVRLHSGVALRQAFYLWRFRNRKVLQVTGHPSKDDAIAAWRRDQQP